MLTHILAGANGHHTEPTKTETNEPKKQRETQIAAFRAQIDMPPTVDRLKAPLEHNTGTNARTHGFTAFVHLTIGRFGLRTCVYLN